MDIEPAAHAPLDSDLTIQILDVGQGDGIYIEFPKENGYRCNMLVDLGSTKNKKLTATDVGKYFKEHTCFRSPRQRLDWLVLTHGDSDHYNMVEDFLTALDVQLGRVIYGGSSDHYKRTFMMFLKSRAEKIYGELNQFPCPLIDDFGGAGVRILGANAVPGGDTASVKNGASVVLQIRYGGTAILLTGDATFASETAIMNRLVAQERDTTKHQAILEQQLRSSILKVAHHGSARTSTQPRWVEAVKPEYVFFSSDRSGSLGDGEKSTGHRLPQALCMSIIQLHTKLANDTDPHSVVSSYDPHDFAGYKGDPQMYPNGVPDPIEGTKHWRQEKTTLGIFSTLAVMDFRVPDPDGAGDVATDLGAQYEIRVRNDGSITIFTTLEED